jgi:hypothetical protein
MDDWFNDSFFNAHQHHGNGIRSHFESMEQHMNDMMGSMFSGFDRNSRPRLENGRTGRSGSRVEEITEPTETAASRGSQRTKATPIVEEPDDAPRSRRAPAHETFFYSSSTTSYSGADGVTHAKRKTYNSATGKTELAEMRALGDQAVAVKREIDADGRVEDAVARKNLDDGDLTDFNERWGKRKPLGLGHAEPAKGRARQRALK